MEPCSRNGFQYISQKQSLYHKAYISFILQYSLFPCKFVLNCVLCHVHRKRCNSHNSRRKPSVIAFISSLNYILKKENIKDTVLIIYICIYMQCGLYGRLILHLCFSLKFQEVLQPEVSNALKKKIIMGYLSSLVCFQSSLLAHFTQINLTVTKTKKVFG